MHERQKRIILLFFIFLALALPLVWRLHNLQVVDGAEFARLALRQQTLSVPLEEVQRGNIYDRKGRSLLNSGYHQRLILFNSVIKDKADVLVKLETVLPHARESIKNAIQKPQNYVIVPKDVTETQASAVNALKLPGVMVAPVRYRYGPEGVAVSLIGHLGKISSNTELANLQQATSKDYRLNDWVGKVGLEKYYEAWLKGAKSEGAVRAFVDARHQLIPGWGVQRVYGDKDPSRQNLYLTLDADIQRGVEEILTRHQVRGAAVVMESATGDLLALASSPSYRQDKVSDYIKLSQILPEYEKVFYDKTILLAQPGSVFKVVVAAAALETGLVTPRSVIKCTPVDGFECNVPEHQGKHTFEEAMAWSCNATFVRLGQQLGAEKLIETAKAMGLDSQKVVGYPFAEDKAQNWGALNKPFALSNGSIGQGSVLANPIQITTMMNVVANNGIYIQPRLMSNTKTSEGRIIKIFPLGKSTRAVSKETAQDIKFMLNSVTSYGTGRDAQVADWGSVGKTGTAQVNKDTGLLYAWFTGFTPVDHPKYVITVLVEDGESGGKTAAPLFREIAEFIQSLE